MAWTYTGDIANVPLDMVRFQVGDVDQFSPLLQDEEINGLMTLYPQEATVVTKCVEAILLKLSRECDYAIGPEKVTASQRYTNYQEQAKRILSKFESASSQPQTWEPNPVTGTGIFQLGMHDC